jgi:hypothetical protein
VAIEKKMSEMEIKILLAADQKHLSNFGILSG